MKVQLIVGSSFDAEYRILDYGKPWHNQRVRVVNRPDPAYTPEGQAEMAELAGYMVGNEDTPLDAVRVYNLRLFEDYESVREKYPDYTPRNPTYIVGIAYYVVDSRDPWRGHFEYKDLDSYLA